MLQNFVNNAASIATDIAKKIDDRISDKLNDRDTHHGPAHFAGGYLEELTGEDMHEYILGCYEDNKELELQVMIAMSFY